MALARAGFPALLAFAAFCRAPGGTWLGPRPRKARIPWAPVGAALLPSGLPPSPGLPGSSSTASGSGSLRASPWARGLARPPWAHAQPGRRGGLAPLRGPAIQHFGDRPAGPAPGARLRGSMGPLLGPGGWPALAASVRWREIEREGGRGMEREREREGERERGREGERERERARGRERERGCDCASRGTRLCEPRLTAWG